MSKDSELSLDYDIQHSTMRCLLFEFSLHEPRNALYKSCAIPLDANERLIHFDIHFGLMSIYI